jgi:hypothetical protein
MGRVFLGLEFVRCYIDDIIVFSTSQKKHRAYLTEVFTRLRLHGLKLHLGKCRFYCDRVEYLGHMIYPGGLGQGCHANVFGRTNGQSDDGRGGIRDLDAL